MTVPSRRAGTPRTTRARQRYRCVLFLCRNNDARLRFIEEEHVSAQSRLSEIHFGTVRLASAQTRFRQGESQSAFRTVVGALDEADFIKARMPAWAASRRRSPAAAAGPPCARARP